MIGNVQRIPAGLLELLGIKGHGTNPVALSESYAAVIPILQFFSRQSNVTLSATDAAAVLNTNVEVTVPQNEVWLVNGLMNRVAEQAAMTVIGQTLSVGFGQSNIVVAHQRVAATFFATGAVLLPWQPPGNPWVLVGGDRLRAGISQLQGVANVNLSIQANVSVISP